MISSGCASGVSRRRSRRSDELPPDVVDTTVTDPEEALPDEDDAAPAPGWLDRLLGR